MKRWGQIKGDVDYAGDRRAGLPRDRRSEADEGGRSHAARRPPRRPSRHGQGRSIPPSPRITSRASRSRRRLSAAGELAGGLNDCVAAPARGRCSAGTLPARRADRSWHVATGGWARPSRWIRSTPSSWAITATQGKSAMPGPLDVGAKLWEHLQRSVLRPRDRTTRASASSSPTRSRASRSAICWPSLVAIPLGFVIGMSPLMNRALDPFIQVLKPISPLAWMPLALYTIKDSGISAIFVIFICSLWPMLINTAFGVASVRRDWLNVAKTLELTRLAHRLAGDPAGGRADDPHGHAHLDRHRLARHRRRRDARRRHRHRLLRLERVEQSLDHQRDQRDPVDRPGRHGSRSAHGSAAAAVSYAD